MNKNNFAICSSKCSSHAFFALQNGEAGIGPECWCGDKFNTDIRKYILVKNKKCENEIKGTNELIGSASHNAVYSTKYQAAEEIKDNVFVAEDCDNISSQKFQNPL